MDPSSIEIERVEEKADTWIFFSEFSISPTRMNLHNDRIDV